MSSEKDSAHRVTWRIDDPPSALEPESSSPPEFGIVSTTGITDDAQSYADAHDIHIIARPQLITLLTDAKLPIKWEHRDLSIYADPPPTYGES